MAHRRSIPRPSSLVSSSNAMPAWDVAALVERLYICRIPKAVAVVAVILLLSANLDLTKVWQFAEMFAGKAVLSERLRLAKFPGISCDVDYGGKAMDLLTPAGMGLAILSVLRLQPGSLGVLAPVCSSMGFLTASQTNRSFFCPLGSSEFGWVQTGNILAIRSILLAWLLVGLGHCFLLEQPSGSMFRHFPQWRFFCKYICVVFRQRVWMRHWGAGSLKPTFLWSNSELVKHFCLGKLTQAQRSGAVRLAEPYVDRFGKARATGNRKRLKKSQNYTAPFGDKVAELLESMPSGTRPLRNPQAFGGASTSTLLAAMSTSDLWGLAEMDSVVSYLLTSRHVDMPPAFRDSLVKGLNCP